MPSQTQLTEILLANARFQGETVDRLKNIETSIGELAKENKALHGRVQDTEEFQTKQKIYLTVAIAIGGVIVWIGDKLLSWLSHAR